MVRLVSSRGRTLSAVTVYLDKTDTAAIQMLRDALDSVTDPEVSVAFVRLEGDAFSRWRWLAGLIGR